MHEPYMSHSLVRTSPFCTSPFCRLPVYDMKNLSCRRATTSCVARSLEPWLAAKHPCIVVPVTPDIPQSEIVATIFFRRGEILGEELGEKIVRNFGRNFLGIFVLHSLYRVAQCSATSATVPATPPCSATPFQTQISVRHLPGMGGGKVRHQNF